MVVYDIDDTSNLSDYSKHNLVGELEFTLHEVVTAKDQIMTKGISPVKKEAVIEITGEELNSAEASNA